MMYSLANYLTGEMFDKTIKTHIQSAQKPSRQNGVCTVERVMMPNEWPKYNFIREFSEPLKIFRFWFREMVESSCSCNIWTVVDPDGLAGYVCLDLDNFFVFFFFASSTAANPPFTLGLTLMFILLNEPCAEMMYFRDFSCK